MYYYLKYKFLSPQISVQASRQSIILFTVILHHCILFSDSFAGWNIVKSILSHFQSLSHLTVIKLFSLISQPFSKFFSVNQSFIKPLFDHPTAIKQMQPCLSQFHPLSSHTLHQSLHLPIVDIQLRKPLKHLHCTSVSILSSVL